MKCMIFILYNKSVIKKKIKKIKIVIDYILSVIWKSVLTYIHWKNIAKYYIIIV